MTTYHFGQFGRIIKEPTTKRYLGESDKYHVCLNDGTEIGLFSSFKGSIIYLSKKTGMLRPHQ